MKDKSIEKIVKVPRVKLSDCTRLIFRLGMNPEWRDMDFDPDLYPVYSLPTLSRSFYNLGGYKIRVFQGSTISDIVREISRVLKPEDNVYLHTMIFRKTGELEIQTEEI